MKTRQLLLTSAAAAGLLLTGCSSNQPQPISETPKVEPTAPPPPDEPSAHDPVVHGTNSVVGEVVDVHPKGAHIKIKSKDGKIHHIETKSDTEFKEYKHAAQEIGKGATDAAKATAASVKKGSIAAVRYSEKEGKMVAHQVQHAARQAVKETEIVVQRVEDNGRKIVAKTKDGAEEVYEVGKDATVSIGGKIADVGKAVKAQAKEGSKATVYFIEDSGKKIAHVVDHQ